MEPTVVRRPGNKGRRYPADPPRVEEIVAVMRQAGGGPYGLRLRGPIVVLWRAGLRIAEAIALHESDLELDQGSLVVRSGKGGRRRTVGMDDWGWQQLRPWLEHRHSLPIGPLFCAINPPRSDVDLPAGHRHGRDRQDCPWPDEPGCSRGECATQIGASRPKRLFRQPGGF